MDQKELEEAVRSLSRRLTIVECINVELIDALTAEQCTRCDYVKLAHDARVKVLQSPADSRDGDQSI